MNAHDIVLRSVITEKSTNLMDNKKYTFNVLSTTTKTQVRNTIEEIFDVKIKGVSIMNARGKDKRVGHYTGETARRRKAIVTLANNSNDTKIFAEEDNK